MKGSDSELNLGLHIVLIVQYVYRFSLGDGMLEFYYSVLILD